ncbi:MULTISPECIES: LysR substrate-binding domain-containing protein [unclassified Burkholderia]|uniref:LysR substrate-binding domain-containing protein n=1 Tax=unclassified Burkholderia TaxID=2613784 RepID=UPI000F56FAF6|nr:MULTISPECIES: LysR substrate-binding domain-containing protein [unclassified Burkholderia]RQS26835.1 LysR family transcriptional regulator [Burkholderia sp. Bp8995]RQS51721.1 LysR family transcriptional regulator [Burkholderia sp. Bp8989]
MDFKQLKYFARIAELGNMTRASEALRIAQPALSQQIANLEGELDTRLFDRTAHGVRLTGAGEVLYRHAKSLLKQFEDVRVAVSQEGEHPSGRVVIGIPGSTGKILAVRLLEELRAYERILLEIVERPSAELVDLIANGKIDIAIAVDAQPRRGTTILPFIHEELYVVYPASENIEKKTLRLKDVARHPLILPSIPSTIRQRIDAAFLDEHLAFRLVSEVSATDMLVRLVTARLGWTVLPWSAVAEYVERGQIGIASISGRTLQRELSLCVSDSLPLSRAAEVVRDTVVKVLEDMLASGKWEGARLIEH